MAAPRIYVQINKFAVKDIFDAKCRSRAIAAMQNAAAQAIQGKLTTDLPRDKSAKGWSLDGSLVSLAPDKAGRRLEAKCSVSISTWPGKAVKATPAGTAATDIAGADRVGDGDIDTVAARAVESAMKTAVKYMEQNAP
ncbi:MAG: hypothetical protein ACXWCU_10815 [Caldimonas sp.]